LLIAFDNHPSNITFDMNKYSFIIVAVLVCWSASAGQLKLTLHTVYEDRALALDSLRYSNDAGQIYSISRLSLFLSDFSLQTSERHLQSFPDSVAWFDVGKREISLMLPNIPDGAYTSIHFKVGLSKERNKSNPWIHPANHPNVSGRYWNWQGGYIFNVVEGLYRDAGSKSPKVSPATLQTITTSPPSPSMHGQMR
jgi:hypothetical protein